MTKVVCFVNRRSRDFTTGKLCLSDFSQGESERARGFLGRFSAYTRTPLHDLAGRARALGVREVLVKDEGDRFGLKAFKVTGGAYAVGRFLAQKLGVDIGHLRPGRELIDKIKDRWGQFVFVTGSSGNHGTGLAWVSQALEQRAIIYVPKGTAVFRKAKLAGLGAEVVETELDYDDTVDLARQVAREKGYQLIADTGWEDYQEVPVWIMQGYTTIFNEVVEQMAEGGKKPPTHVFLHGGVGSFSGAAVGYFSGIWKHRRSKFVVIEPTSAACLLESARQADGKAHRSKEKIDTVMAGLGCAEPNPMAWPILFDYADFFISCSDSVAEDGMREYARVVGDDPQIISGASGAAGMGVLTTLMNNKDYSEIKSKLGIGLNSRILLFNTEGDTDPEHYREICGENF